MLAIYKQKQGTPVYVYCGNFNITNLSDAIFGIRQQLQYGILFVGWIFMLEVPSLKQRGKT